MKKNVFSILIGLAIIVGAIVLSGYLINSKPDPQKNSLIHNTMNVKASQIKYSDIETNMKYRGRVSAFNTVDLTAEVSGRILQGDILFKEGESFKKNDIIVRIYKEDVLATHKASISSFLQTLAQILPDIKVDYPNEYEKWNNFFIAIDPEQNLPELPQINSNQEKVFLSANNVLTNYYNLQNQEINLAKYTIRAPFNGTLKTVNREIGAAASMGSTLATLIRSDKLEITVPVFTDDIQWIKKGDTATLIERTGAETSISVSRISGYVDEETQSVNVYLTFYPSSQMNLLEGEYVDIAFEGQTVNGFEIPRESLVGETYVYVLNEGKLDKTKINIIRSLNDTYIITGIEENKTIVTESLASISSNVEYIARD
ncbi:efflux RND transporter periplasmic adaptor subunit [Plebeiibacterium sediminum]|uniref:HlyD family efflux transporter periplasmic adaptor subunit n=1 Tax=Plebeiibacterium sediminum TaxID=2992112 RepID=A0AAE3M2D0_9BACT|nr:HlyD family efflux transporter periplasmic adaptor subunit [Plebeiobacterium sediminum]MCW3785932.1 HlyD family efflux transporter periplasmic adaptor subunit [Plebeiobacterium sediminum]